MSSSVLKALGLQAPSNKQIPTPNFTGYYLIWNFIFAYAVLSSRVPKFRLGIDSNANPRYDLKTRGEEAVRKGKMTRKQLDQLRRRESAHANAVEHFPVFAAALLWADQTGVPAEIINRSAAFYSVVRILYAVAYLGIESEAASGIRSVLWWAGNITCLRLFWKGTRVLNGRLP